MHGEGGLAALVAGSESHGSFFQRPFCHTTMSSYIFVQWLEEKNLSVLSATVAHPGDKMYVGAFGEYKWDGKFYEGEILGVSGECTVVCPT